MHNYFRHIKLPFDIDLSEFAKFDCNLTLTSYCRKSHDLPIIFVDFLKSRGMHLLNVASFHTPANGMLPCHIDLDKLSNFAKLNFSYGAPDSRMFWYKLKEGYELNIQANDFTTKYYAKTPNSLVSYVTIPLNKCILQTSTIIGTPTLVNTGQPHSIFNSNNSSRWTVCVALTNLNSTEPLQFADIEQRLSDCII